MFWNYTNQAFVFDIWPEAADIAPATYTVLMQTANSLCVAYAPALPLGQALPDAWKIAEVRWARHLWGQMNAGSREEYGPDGMAIPVARLDLQAQDLLRPKTSPLGRLR